MGALRLFLIVAALAYAAIVLFMYVQQRSIQYLPSRNGTSPQAAGLTGVGERRIATADGETIVLWHAEPRPGMPTILLFHGNGGELADRAGRMSYYQSRGFGALFVSYRGYGASTGSPTEAGLMADALAAYEFLLDAGVKPEDIAVVGESLGTGVAVQLAAQKPVAALALEAPFTAAADAGADIYLWLPVRLLMKDQFRSRDYIASVKAPLLIQHGSRDRVIPVAQGEALFALANEPKELAIIPDAGHNMIADQLVWAREADFFLAKIRRQ